MKKLLKDHFIPHENNDYAPHILQRAAVVGMLGLVLLSFTAVNMQSLLWTSSQWMVSTILPAVVTAETNQERTASALPALSRNPTLDAAATLKAKHMAEVEYFSHYSPDGVSPWHWFKEVAYGYVHAGENLAIHFSDSSEVVEAWMDSPTHRANIMNDDYTEIGIGTAKGKYDGHSTVYVVQLFGTPSSAYADELNTSVKEAPLPPADTVSPNVPTIAGIEVPTPVPVELGLPESVPPTAPPLVVKEVVVEPKVIQVAVEPVTDTHLGVEPPSGDEVVDEPSTQSAVADSEEDEPVLVFSDHISTSTGGIPASLDSGTGNYTTTPTLAFATQPHYVLQVIYTVLGLFVFIALIMSFLIEIHHHRPVQTAYGVGLLATMMLLFYIHISVATGVLIA